jgi:nitrous oxidase accessory protein
MLNAAIRQLIRICVLCIVGGLIISATQVQAHAPTFDLGAALVAAQPGDVITVPAGVYAGPLRIDKAVTLQADGGAVIDGNGLGDVVTIVAPDVTIRGFTIRNSGDSLDREHSGITVEAPRATIEHNRLEDVLFGLYLKNAPGSVLRANKIFSKDLDIARRGDGIKVWYSAGCLIDGNQVSGSRDVIVWYSPRCTVQNNVVEASRYGIHLMNSDQQVLSNNVLRHNSVGVYVMYGRSIDLRDNVLYDNHGPSGYGIGLKDAVNVAAIGNRLVSNRVGLYVDNSPPEPKATVRFERNLLAYNEIGIELLPNVKRNIYVNNSFLENGEQVTIAGGGDAAANQWSLAGQGNYWSDYVGFDADGDRVGDLPYRSQRLFEELTQQHPELRLFQGSPATAALDLAARAFPIFQPRPMFTDEHPLLAPPTLPVVIGLPTAPVFANLIAALGIIGLAVVILTGGWRRVAMRSDK